MDPKAVCWRELNRKHREKYGTFKTKYWEEKPLRPEKNGNRAVLAYEIYSKKGYPNEHETAAALNELVAEGKAEIIHNGEFYWYVKK